MKAMVGCGLIFLAVLRLVDLKSALVASSLFYATFILFRLCQLYRNQQLVKHIPGESYLLTPWASMLAFFLPPIKYINAPLNDQYNNSSRRRKRYETHNSTITSFIGALPPRISIHTADAVAIKAITSDRKVYPKPLELYRILAVYGENVVITEGDEWRKHRRIVGTSFNETNNKLDWEQSTLVTRHWMESLDKSRNVGGQSICDNVAHLCLHLTLSILCSTAFGVSIASPGQPEDPPAPGHKHNLKQTLEGALQTLYVTVITPKWMQWVPSKALREAKEYKQELDTYLREMIEERRKGIELGEERGDLLSSLVKANNAEIKEKSESGLSQETMDLDELSGNLFMFLVAGHETSAHTLAFAFGLLALYPEEQDKLLEEIHTLVPHPDHDIPYSDYPLFVRAQAILNETLRLYPSVIAIPKKVYAEQDVILPCSERGPQGSTSIFVPKNTHVTLDVQSMHHDSHYWPEPELFKPDRFIDTDDYRWNRDAFVPFSAGARSCVGQKFAQVEIVCILVNLIRKYRICLHPEDVKTQESLQEKQARILVAWSRLTLTPLHLRLSFERR